MMSYRDMTFCRGEGCAKFKGCPRALTKEVQEAAKKWWGDDDAPISIFAEPKELHCYQAPLKQKDSD
jgi:hypothetical protein